MADVVYLKPQPKEAVRMPRSVRIGHRLYELILWDRKAAGPDRGCIIEDPPAIRIGRDLKPFDRAEVALHEVFHGCWKLPSDTAKEEDAVDMLARNFSAVWRDNPKFVSWISHCLGTSDKA
jgi:hypothetical protein